MESAVSVLVTMSVHCWRSTWTVTPGWVCWNSWFHAVTREGGALPAISHTSRVFGPEAAGDGELPHAASPTVAAATAAVDS